MKIASMTALISVFARAYHSEKNQTKIFDDCVARKLLSDKEFNEISLNMKNGIRFFNPRFEGDEEAALHWIVNHQLSPSPLGRSAFAEGALQTAARMGCKQYLIFGAGYDTFAYRQPDWSNTLQIFELDA
ncbi:MAG: class I SAM-dependent methyltransferase, partial [Bacilli bacterium]